MDIAKVDINASAGLKVKGEIDMHSASNLHKTLMSTIEGLKSGMKLYIDMSEVEYMDSSGIAVFVDALRHTNKIKAELILYNPSTKIVDVFSIARLQSVFKIERTA